MIPAGGPGCSTPAANGWGADRDIDTARVGKHCERKSVFMNLRWREQPLVRQVLQAVLLVFFLVLAAYLYALIQPSISSLEVFARANSTRTSIALTSQALFGPFPTPTGPTPTPSRTRPPTSSPTPTPSTTPSPTPIRYFIDTGTPRTLVPGFDPGSTSSPQATNPPRQPTQPPQATNPPRPTNPPRATNPPRPTHPPHATHVPHSTRVPRPTRTPRR